MPPEPFPVAWSGTWAVVTLPEHIDAQNTGPFRDELLGLVNRGPEVLIADMTQTVSCDYGGADALVRAYHRASVNRTQLRIAAASPLVRRVLSVHGLDRLVSVYPSLEAAQAARPPRSASVAARPGPANGGQAGTAAITPAILWNLLDALADGIILVTGDGVLALANRRAEEMFGYQHGTLAGQPVETLVPDALRDAHAGQRDAYQRQPTDRPMGTRSRLAGLRKDGTTFPVRVSLSPVRTATGHLTLAVVRDITESSPRANLAELARAIADAPQASGREFLHEVVSSLQHTGRTLQDAQSLPREQAVQRIEAALRQLDALISQIRSHAFPGGEEPPAAVAGGPPHR